jgi:hypothetical protein
VLNARVFLIMLRQEHRRALHRVCATSEEVHDRTGDVGEDIDGCERPRIKNACLIVVSCPLESASKTREVNRFELTNKYATARENIKERIEIIWAGPLEPVEEDCRITAGNSRKNLNGRFDWSICTRLATQNKDTAIGQNKCSWVPTSRLYNEIIDYRYVVSG